MFQSHWPAAAEGQLAAWFPWEPAGLPGCWPEADPETAIAADPALPAGLELAVPAQAPMAAAASSSSPCHQLAQLQPELPAHPE